MSGPRCRRPAPKAPAADSATPASRRKHNTDADNYRKPWSVEEDAKLRSLVEEHGMQQWALIASNMPERNGKQCRERWHNQLDGGLSVSA